MNLYLLKRTDDKAGTGQISEAVVACNSEEEARQMDIPFLSMGYRNERGQVGHCGKMWALPEDMEVQLIGTTAEGIQFGVISHDWDRG